MRIKSLMYQFFIKLQKGSDEIKILTTPHSLPIANLEVKEQNSNADTDALVPAISIPITWH